VIHDAGVVHRDVKPENVLLAAAGHGTRPMLTDLGVALLAGCGRLTAPSGLVGTPDYVAPETISGARPTPAADVYATGVLLYELLAGRTPFGADHPAAVLYQQVHAEPEPIPDVPAVLWALISRCLAKQPLDRPGSAELASALRGAVPGLRAGVTHVPSVPGGQPPRAVTGAVPARAVLESATPVTSQATHLGWPRLPPEPPEPSEPPTVRRRSRRWPYALAAFGTGLLAAAAPLLYDDREVTYRADTGWICADWPVGDGATAGVRPCVLASAGSVRAAVQVRTDAPGVEAELHLVRLGESATVVVSGRCRSPGEGTAGCGTLSHPLDGRYVAVATARGGVLAATPPVSR
jgi:hypothetical protein